MTEPGPSRRQYHLHRTLAIYIFVSLLVAVGAFNSNNNLLFWLFGLSLGLLLVSGVISGAMLMGVRVRRLPMEPTTVGGYLVVRYRVSNVNRFMPAFALRLVERTSRPRGNQEHLPAQAELGPTGTGRGAGLPVEAFVGHVAPRSSVVIEARIPAAQRGLMSLDHFDVVTEFPFGIVRKSLRFEQAGSTHVWPVPAELPPGLLADVPSARGRPLADPLRSTRPGAGDEFLSLREYRLGDGLRSVAWKASARTPSLGRDPNHSGLMVTETASEKPRVRRLEVWLALTDADGQVDYERAIGLAAAAVHEGLTRHMVVSLRTLGDWPSPLAIPGRGGERQRAALLTELALLPAFIERSIRREAIAPANLSSDEHAQGTLKLVVCAGPAPAGLGDAKIVTTRAVHP